MEEDAGVGDEGQTEVKSQGQIILDAVTDWKVVYMALKYVILRTPGAYLTFLLHEASPASSSLSHSTRSSQLSPLHLGITEL